MSLFQPTNISPSAFIGIGGGVVAQNDAVSVSWQINGTSAMTSFSIAFYLNDAAGTKVYETDQLTTGCPFYGTDQNGKPQLFSYRLPNTTWDSLGFTNGNQYKMYITQNWDGGSVVQRSPSVFWMKAKPTLALDGFLGLLDSVSQTFYATFSQEQGDTVNWCRWQLAFKTSPSTRDLIEDTGEISTGLLQFAYDGFLSSNTYSVMCTVQSSSGVTVSTGWQDFEVYYETSSSENSLSVSFTKDGAALIDLFGENGSMVPDLAENTQYAFDDSGALLLSSGNLNWNKRFNRDLNIPQPFSLCWQGTSSAFLRFLNFDDSFVTTAVSVSHDGNTAYIGGSYQDPETLVESYTVRVFSISSNSLDFLYSIPQLDVDVVRFIATDPSDSVMVVGGEAGAQIYSISNISASYVRTIEEVGTSPRCLCGAFTNDQRFFMGGNFGLAQFSYIGTVFTFTTSENYPDETIVTMSVSANSSYLAIGLQSGLDTIADVFSIKNNTFNAYASIIPQSGASIVACNQIVFSPTSDPFFALSGYYLANGQMTTINAIYKLPDDSSGDITKQVDIPIHPSGTQDTVSRFVFMQDGNSLLKLWNRGTFGAYYGWNPENPTVCTFHSTVSFPSYGYAAYSSNHRVLIAGSNDFLSAYLFMPYQTKLFELTGSDNYSTLTVWRNGEKFTINSTNQQSQDVAFQSERARIQIRPDSVTVSFDTTEYNAVVVPISTSVPNVTSIQLFPSLTEFLWIMKGDSADFTPYDTATITPDTYFVTQFPLGTLSAIGYATIGGSNYIYRKDENDRLSLLSRILTYYGQIKDYGLKSGSYYQYRLLQKGATEPTVSSMVSRDVCIRYRSYYLIEATQDPNVQTVFHALNVWRFGCNVEAGSVSNNNTPNWITNFTKYRYRQTVSRMGKSGKLSALLSNVKDCSYQDTVAQMEALYALSESTNPLFLKDMKGNLYMVQISGPIVQTINTKSALQEVKVSVPWEEIGSAEKISLIKLPTDAGWKKNQVQQVKLTVDSNSGVLSAVYPNAYQGSEFYMQNRSLFARTDEDMPAAQFTLENGTVFVQTEDS